VEAVLVEQAGDALAHRQAAGVVLALDLVGPAHLSVVLDFPANTPASRQWMRSLFERAGADHRLHFLDVPDEVCKARLRARNAAGTHAFNASDAEFDLFTRYFVPPSADEGFAVEFGGESKTTPSIRFSS
jgi:hypothetical protein